MHKINFDKTQGSMTLGILNNTLFHKTTIKKNPVAKQSRAGITFSFDTITTRKHLFVHITGDNYRRPEDVVLHGNGTDRVPRKQTDKPYGTVSSKATWRQWRQLV